MIEILDKLIEARNDNGFESSIKAIRDMGYKFLEEDSTRGNDPKKLTIDICKKLTESVAVTKAYLNVLENLYYDSILAYNSDKKNDFFRKSKIIKDLIDDRNLINIEDRIRKYTNSKKESIFLVQAKDNEFFIDKDGLIRKYLIHFDCWYENDKKTIIDFYRNSVKKIFKDTSGYLVFIDKQIGAKGPIILKNILEEEFSKLGIITISNNNITIEKESRSNRYCILDDIIFDNYKNIENYRIRLKNKNPDLKLDKTIVLYDSFHKTLNKDQDKSISLINLHRHKSILSQPSTPDLSLLNDSTTFEAIMFGIGSAVAFGDAEVGLQVSKYTKEILEKFGLRKKYS